MWTIDRRVLVSNRVDHYVVRRDDRPATFGEVVSALADDIEFCHLLNKTLAVSSFKAFRWETPAVSSATLGRPFEFVLVDSPGLTSMADSSAFAKQFGDSADPNVVVFPNLGRDAILVVPRQITDANAYAHLATFMRLAPDTQQLALWRSVGTAMLGRLSARPVWLSTAGAGVPWLHVRLDDRPKYYAHGPYRLPV